jgi:hypothetical protein
MSQKSQLLHDSSLVIRLPKALHTQLEQVATAQYMKMGELVRNLIKDEIKRASPYLGATQPIQQINKPKPTITKPSQRWDSNDPDFLAEQKRLHELREAEQRAKTEAYLEALRNGQKPPQEEDDPWN